MFSQEEIKKNHSNSWENIWTIYNSTQKFYKGPMFITTTVLNIAIYIIVFLLNTNLFQLISKTTDLYLSVLPNLLGFNLGAYALLIGLASSNILIKLTKGIDNSFTFFQKASSVFAISIVLQGFTLLIAFIIKQVIMIQEIANFYYDKAFEYLIIGINFCVFVCLNFFGIYSLLMILMLVKNIFGLSQTANFLGGVENIDNEKQKAKKLD